MALKQNIYTDKDYFDNKFGEIEKSLIGIKNQLRGMNINIASHEKIINENLPHSIDHCPQSETIETLKENMVTTKSVKKTIYTSIIVLGVIISIIWGVSEIFFK